MRAVYRTLAAGIFACSAWAAPDVGKLVEQLKAGDNAARRDAAYELRQLAPGAKAAVPALIEALSDKDQQVFAFAVDALAEFGPASADAVPKLIDGMNSRNARGFRDRDKAQGVMRSAYALSRIGKAAIAPLISALKSEDSMQRSGAAFALGGMNEDAKDAVTALVESLGDREVFVRHYVVEALGTIGTAAVEPLIASLASPNAEVRAGSAAALASIGKPAAASGPALLKRFGEEKEPTVRAAIVHALPRVGLDPAKSVPPLVVAFTDGDDGVRAAAFDALLLVRPADKTAVPAVAALLKSPDHATRAARLLGRYGSAAKTAIPALMVAASAKTPPDQEYMDAMIDIGGASVPALLKQVEKVPPAQLNREHWTVRTLGGIGIGAQPELEAALASKNASARAVAVGALIELGPQARSSRPAVMRLSNDPEPAVRAAVMSASVSLGGSPSQALELLSTGMMDKSESVRLAAVTAADAIGSNARPLAKPLGDLLDDTSPAVRAAALKALAAVGDNDPALAEKFAARLDDPAMRVAAVEALGKLGHGAKAAAPKLVELYPKSDKPTRLAILVAFDGGGEMGADIFRAAIKDQDAELRVAGLRALAAAGTPPNAISPVLAEALGDSDLEVRRAAAEIAGKVGERDERKVPDTLKPLAGLLAKESDSGFAAEALRRIRVRDMEVIMLAMESPSVAAKMWAIEAIGAMGAAGREHRKLLEDFMREGNDDLRNAARRALKRLGG